MRRAFTTEQDKEVVKLYQEGLSTRKIGEMFGVDKTSVSEALKREGIARRDNREVTDEEELRICQLYQGGLTIDEIAKETGKGWATVKAALVRRKVKRPDDRYTFTPEQEREVIEAYLGGQTMTEIGERYGARLKTVRGVLERHSIDIRDGRIFDDEQEEGIASLYNSGLSAQQVADHYGASRAVIENALERQDVTKREKRTRFFNKCAFDDLNSELPLYWIGFLYADGYASDAELKLGLAIKDLDHVKKFSEFMGGDNHIRITPTVCAVNFASIYLVERVRRLGIVVRRNHFHLLEPLIPEGLEHHFIRGLLDGDGCLSVNKQVAFAGQLDSLTWVSNTLNANIGTNINPIRHRQGICEVSWGGRYQIKRIIEYLYQDATVWLDRKRQIAQRW